MSIADLKESIKKQFIPLFDSVLLIAEHGKGTNKQAYNLLKTKLLDKQIHLLLVDDFHLKEVKVYRDNYAYDGYDGDYITIDFICQQLEKSIEQNKSTSDIANYGFGAKRFYASVESTLNIPLPQNLVNSALSPDCYHDADNPLTDVVKELIAENNTLKSKLNPDNKDDYLTLDEAIIYLDGLLKKKGAIRKAKELLEDKIREKSIIPLFYFDGYAVLYRMLEHGKEYYNTTKPASSECKQILRIKGYFYDSAFHYSDSLDLSRATNAFSNIADESFPAYSVIPHKVIDVYEHITHKFDFYIKSKNGELSKSRIYDKERIGKVLDFETYEVLTLFESLPHIDEELFFTNSSTLYIERRNIYFKSKDINSLASSIESHNTDDPIINNLQSENAQLKNRIADLESQLKQAQSSQSDNESYRYQDNKIIAMMALMLAEISTSNKYKRGDKPNMQAIEREIKRLVDEVFLIDKALTHGLEAPHKRISTCLKEFSEFFYTDKRTHPN